MQRPFLPATGKRGLLSVYTVSFFERAVFTVTVFAVFVFVFAAPAGKYYRLSDGRRMCYNQVQKNRQAGIWKRKASEP